MALAALALIALLYHSLNHALIKSLLFLGTGAVLHSTGERNLGRLGGLIHRMPWVAALTLLGALAMSGVMITQEVISAPQAAKTELKPATTLPISRVLLFSSGVAHYNRSAEIEGEARIDLTFPEQDINDLIKSMTLQDFSEKGRISAVTYDSHEPKLGRPTIEWPLDMKICAGAWLNCVVVIERTTASSSEIAAKFGTSSENSWPDCP